MFKIARFVVQHKVGAAAVIALGVFIMTPSKDEQEGRSNNPWAAQPATAANFGAAEEPGMVDQIIAEADTMLAESGYDPREAADESVGRFEGAAESYSKANGN